MVHLLGLLIFLGLLGLSKAFIERISQLTSEYSSEEVLSNSPPEDKFQASLVEESIGVSNNDLNSTNDLPEKVVKVEKSNPAKDLTVFNRFET